ncbi:DTW domain-containing protein [soil metagenome]
MKLDLPSVTTKRASCPRCLRPQTGCICAWIRSSTPKIEVLILQHPLEVQQSKGSARLLHLSLGGSHMYTGEIFDPAQLQHCLQEGGKSAVLLYPEPQAQGDLLAMPPLLNPALLLHPERLRLIVLDGTWRKSRKMLYLNPLLQQLPRFSLSAMPASHYRIRKAHKPDQLSTLEASCYALMQLEKNPEKYLPLLQAFDGFVGQQLKQQLSQGAARQSN